MVQYNYAVRITHSYDVCKTLVTTWSYRCKKMLVYEHIGSATEKIHIHMIIEEADCSKKWLRELGTRQGVNLKGNAYCSFKDFDGNKTAMVYMTKGVHEPKFNKGYNEEDIALWKSQWTQKPKSRDEAIYDSVFGNDEYNDEMFNDWSERNPPEPNDIHYKFRWVKSVAWSRSLMDNGYIVNMKTINQYKMLVYSYCARNGVYIPDGPTFKNYG